MRCPTPLNITKSRTTPLITSTSYNRNALDTVSDIPLCYSLSNLCHLLANIEEIREIISLDGGAGRLIEILLRCTVEIVDENATQESQIHIIKKNSIICWKWSMALQCLVIIGTRGTEEIRQRLVNSGILRLLATILDNYLIIQRNIDFKKNTPANFQYHYLNDKTNNNNLDKGYNYNALLNFLMQLNITKPKKSKSDKKTNKDSNTENNQKIYFNTESLIHANYSESVSFGKIWNEIAPNIEKSHLKKSLLLNSETSEDIDMLNSYFSGNNTLSIYSPRTTFLNKIIPNYDDVIGCLQLLAFISKYPSFKDTLQNVNIIQDISLRSTDTNLKYLKQDLTKIVNPSIGNSNDAVCTIQEPKNGNYHSCNTDTFLSELQMLSKQIELKTQLPHKTSDDILPKIMQNYANSKDSNRYMVYQHLSLAANEPNSIDTPYINENDNKNEWNEYCNLFPLVEQFTVQSDYTEDEIYWSSVTMRNFCRKDTERGIRQCANFECGLWESKPKEFSKCRRCRKTKYCSKSCQLVAWEFHKYWCKEAKIIETVNSSTSGATTLTRSNSTNSINDTNDITLANSFVPTTIQLNTTNSIDNDTSMTQNSTNDTLTEN